MHPLAKRSWSRGREGSTPSPTAKFGRYRWVGWQLVLKTRDSGNAGGSTPLPSSKLKQGQQYEQQSTSQMRCIACNSDIENSYCVETGSAIEDYCGRCEQKTEEASRMPEFPRFLQCEEDKSGLTPSARVD